MGVYVSQSLSLKIPPRKAEKRLAALIDRGERLILIARRLEAQGHEHAFVEHWSLWYMALIAALKEIYPTTRESDLIHRAQESGATWPMRIRHVIDALENLKDTVRQYGKPPIQVTIVTWISERPGFRLLIEGLLVIAAGIVIAKTTEIVELFKRLIP